jgi:hypothetical protein
MHYTFGANCYMFRHQGAIFREFISNRIVSPRYDPKGCVVQDPSGSHIDMAVYVHSAGSVSGCECVDSRR